MKSSTSGVNAGERLINRKIYRLRYGVFAISRTVFRSGFLVILAFCFAELRTQATPAESRLALKLMSTDAYQKAKVGDVLSLAFNNGAPRFRGVLKGHSRVELEFDGGKKIPIAKIVAHKSWILESPAIPIPFDDSMTQAMIRTFTTLPGRDFRNGQLYELDKGLIVEPPQLGLFTAMLADAHRSGAFELLKTLLNRAIVRENGVDKSYRDYVGEARFNAWLDVSCEGATSRSALIIL